jgi:hypothetical protein
MDYDSQLKTRLNEIRAEGGGIAERDNVGH